jgi:hypothetical protein
VFLRPRDCRNSSYLAKGVIDTETEAKGSASEESVFGEDEFGMKKVLGNRSCRVADLFTIPASPPVGSQNLGNVFFATRGLKNRRKLDETDRFGQ